MASTAAKKDAVTWCLHWFTAAVNQAQRVVDAESIGDRETELLVFVLTLRNSLRSARVVLGAKHPLVVKFDEASAGLKDLRDMLEHHDAYLQGSGHLQKERRESGLAPFFTLMTSSGSGSHALSVLLRTSPVEGAAPTVVTVDVRQAVAAIIPVIRAAIDFKDPKAEPESLARARALVETSPGARPAPPEERARLTRCQPRHP